MRNRTTGILETEFQVDGIVFKIVDVGGQRSERKKWIKLFNNANSELFVVAVGEYDLAIWEDKQTNKIHEALDVFQAIVNESVFAGVPIIFFLNEADLFEKKIETTPLTVCFPDYPSEETGDSGAAFSFIENKFREESN